MAVAFRPLSDLLLIRDLLAAGGDPRALRRAQDRGEVVRIRRGAYCARDRWSGFTPRERHLALAHAATQQARTPPLLAGPTAAAAWGMPIPGPFPDEVVVLDRYRGGGRSEPGVRRVSVGAESAESVLLGGLRVTTVARTALDIARSVPFEYGVGPVDWALWRKNPRAISRQQLEQELARFAPRTGGSRMARAVAFATELSDSFGESRCRAVIHESGFSAPVLQLELVDEQGSMFPDFAWPEIRVLAEFDGDIKFTDPGFSGGDPLGKLRAQRRREARLRRLGWTIVRIEWADLEDRGRLVALLAAAGVPRRGQ